MGLWNDHAVPRIVAIACNTRHEREIRARVCTGLRGRTLEIGFGSGLNVPFYPAAVSDVVAVDPSPVSRKLAARRVEESSVPITYSGVDAQTLSVDDGRFDSVLSTYTLCTVPDPKAVLCEMLRVLRPGGQLRFAEHGRSRDAKVARRQDRLDPLQRRLAGGCHVTRNIPALIRDAGFMIEDLRTYYAEGAPKYAGYMYEGWATKL